MMKKKMSDLTKAKLIYSGELIIIAIVFAVLGILEITGVRPIKPNHLKIFNWITIFGGTWVITDFIWMLISPRRRKKNCLLDKCLNLPLGLYLIGFDIYCFITRSAVGIEDFSTYFMAIYGTAFVFLYVFVSYTFQGIYHWFNPLPTILEEIKKEEEEKQKQESSEPVEEKENKEE